jgi:hypothetical protein
LSRHDEINAQGFEFSRHRRQVPDAPRESIQLPHEHGIELAASRGQHQTIELWALALGPRDAAVHVLGSHLEPPRCGILSQLVELELGGLVTGGDAGVDREAHELTPP